jgi:hypothetical protein
MMTGIVCGCVVALFGTGWILARLLRAAEPGAWYILGVSGLVFSAAWLDLAGVRLGRVAWMALAAPGFLAGILALARWVGAGGAKAARSLSWFEGLVLLTAVLVQILILVQALAVPMEGFDARYIWGFKAKVLAHEHTLYAPPFLDPTWPHLHRGYPAGIAWLESIPAVVAGTFDDRALKLLFPWFLVSLALTVYGGARRELSCSRARALVWAALVACLPPFFWHPEGGTAHDGYTDLPLAASYAAAAVTLLAWLRSPSMRALLTTALLAALCGYLKREGQLLAALLLAVIVVRSWRARDWRSPLAFAAVLALLWLPHFAFLRALPEPEAMTVRPPADEDYLALIRERGLGEILAQLPAALVGVARVPFARDSGGFGFLAIAVGLMAFVARARSGAPRVARGHLYLLAYLTAAPLLVYAAAFATRPFETVQTHVGAASTRLWMHVVGPLFLLLACLNTPGDQPSNPSRPRW